jgi:hypothetical protein
MTSVGVAAKLPQFLFSSVYKYAAAIVFVPRVNTARKAHSRLQFPLVRCSESESWISPKSSSARVRKLMIFAPVSTAPTHLSLTGKKLQRL